MATYFHGSASEINSCSSPSAHADGLQTLYLMNPNNYHAPYSDAPHHQTPATPNMLLLNPNAAATHHTHALNLANFTHAPPLSSPNQHQHLATIFGSANSDDHSRPSLFGPHEITTAFHGFSPASASAAGAPRVHYNLWGSVVDQTQQSSAAATPSSSSAGGGDVSPQTGFRRPSQQGLSLSLSSQQQRTINYRSFSGEIVGNSPSSVSNGTTNVQSVILGSKYLKATQELLDEVVNGNNKGNYKEELAEKVKGSRDSTSGVGDGSSGGGGGGGENSDVGKHVAELTTAQRQEHQMKKSKLVSMLDEVEQRYRQYHRQMQIVISSFEQAAGFGAKSYTALALKTISKQFRCLKDAISSQIRAASKTLGEEDCLGVKMEGSRLRYVDHHLRQQRALQQLGMIQPNAWRPQRGLPERAVSILRAWLFEHFLHPYPKDSDKIMLAKQTGLTRSQVSNWFINARVRLWKPMVEEMYLEEIKDPEHNNNNNVSDNTTIIRSKQALTKELGSSSNNPNNLAESDAIKLDQIKIPQSKQQFFNNHNNQNTTSPTAGGVSVNSSMSTSLNMGGGASLHQSHAGGGFHLVGGGSSDKPSRTTSEMLNSPSSILSSVDMEMKHHNTNKFIAIDESHTKDGYPLMTGISTNHGGGDGGYGAFSMEDIGSRFNNVTDQLASTRFQGNGVSLTLGLPHNNENLSISGTHHHHQHQHGFLSQNIHNLGRRLEIGTNNNGNEFCVINTAPPPSSHSGGGGGASYESSIDIQNRKRFAAQLLPDFVA